MYTEWVSLSPQIAENSASTPSISVLNKFSSTAGRDVTVPVVKQLAANLGIAHQEEPSKLTTDEEVQWCMGVICYGLSLPLVEHETIKDCVTVYCEWLTALNPSPRASVPKPICEEPNIYARKMINHFHNLFVPRPDESPDTINRQVMLCHRVLRTLQQIAQTSQILNKETWEALLLFLLAINEILLAPPTIKDDVGDTLCERVLSVLFEVWLLACVRCFPSPSLWKTLQESCAAWRHRIALIEQWNRVNLALTARLLEFTYGPTFPALKILEEDAQLIPQGMSNDCIAQTWYRFLRTIGTPTALCSATLISKTPQFMQWAMTRQDGAETYQHPCLLALPQIFLKSIKGIASQVDAFLGIYQLCDDNTTSSGSASEPTQKFDGKFYSSSVPFQNQAVPAAPVVQFQPTPSTSRSGGDLIGGGWDAPHSPTPPLQRRLAKSFSVAPSASQKGISKGSLIGLTSSRSSTVNPPLTPNSGPPSSSSLTSIPSIIGQEPKSALAPGRPKCNSILHLFGEWLFEAAHIGGDAWIQNLKKQAVEASRRPSSMIMDNRKGSLSLSQPTSLNETHDLPPGLTIDKYESGRAEAIGALCRIFCAKKTGEEILPVYLARFYMAIQQGLKVTENRECEEVLASILYNSGDIFRLDLDGVQVLLPSFISALELVLPDKELKMRSHSIFFNKTELRRASIHILISILALPLHFQSLPIRDLNNPSSDRLTTFAQQKPRLINILMSALQVETDAHNTHMLLGGLLFCVQDSSEFEEVEGDSISNLSPPHHSESNLLSSACSERSACSLASGNSSIGGNSTATMGNNDFPSLTISDDLPADYLMHDLEINPNYDSAHALFVRATYLVCHRLISSWKTDLNVSLAALELLSGLAKMKIRDSDALECKRAVKWICDYICYQCSRPPPAHSKDLHSTIVAAFQCTSAWLMQHPYLLEDKDCLTTVLEVVELGISGTKSVGKPGESVKFKDEKELKPASMRVRDAAETLLTIILEQVGYFPSECGPQSLSSLLDEVALVKHCNSIPGVVVNHDQAVQKFKYFVTENSTILALLEEPLGNDQDPQPTITLIIRGPFGRHAWTMQLRHLPRSKSGTKYHAPNPGRPVPMNDTPQRVEPEQKYFPDGVDRVLPCVADYSIPTLDTVIQKMDSDSTKRLFQLLESQTVFEKIAWAETDNSVESLSHTQEAVPPPVCHEFQAARLFLSHFGFLSIDNGATQIADDSLTASPLLTVLDTKKSGFSTDICQLDSLSPRIHDTVHMFYVKVGQTKAHEIVDNMSEENVTSLDKHFWNMLPTLGSPVDVEEHPGWTGFLHNSWRVNINNSVPSTTATATTTAPTMTKNFGADSLKYNGEKRVLYWADVGAEIAFVVPTKWNKNDSDIGGDASCSTSINSFNSSSESDNATAAHQYERSISVAPQFPTIGKAPAIGQKPRTLSLELDKNKSDPIAPSRRRTGTTKPSLMMQTGAKIMLVWLESYEDYQSFPIDDLLAYTRTGEESQTGTYPRASECHVVFLHALNSGLLRVKLQGPVGRMSFATPLVDGMVISKRVVGSLVRQTAHNMTKRRRLDNDSYQPPHVRRRHKVQEMVQRYKLDMTEPELLAHLFKSV